MSTLKARMMTNWHLMRMVRLGIGLMLLIAGIQNRDWMVGLFSTFFLFQAVTDTGCCGAGACYTPNQPLQHGVGRPDADTIDYEEIK